MSTPFTHVTLPAFPTPACITANMITGFVSVLLPIATGYCQYIPRLTATGIQLCLPEFPEPIETRVSGAYRNPYTLRIIFSLFYRLEHTINNNFLYIHESRTSIPLCSGREQILLPKTFINKRNTIWLGTVLLFSTNAKDLYNYGILHGYKIPYTCLQKSPTPTRIQYTYGDSLSIRIPLLRYVFKNP
jgi:hypothetical protein